MSAIEFRRKMHFNMTHYVNESTKLWYFEAWKSSIKIIFNDVTHTQKNELIISDDIIRSITLWTYRFEKMIFIDWNYRQNIVEFDEIVVTVQVVIKIDHFMLSFFDIEIIDDHDLFLIENMKLKFEFHEIEFHVNVYINREYDENDNNVDDYSNKRYYLRWVLNAWKYYVKSLRQFHQIKDEFKIEYFTRQHFIEVFDKSSFLSLFYFFFVNDFDAHKNMYWALKAFYLISICFFYIERRKIVNVFTFTLNSHDVNIRDVVEIINKSLRHFDRDMKIEINEKMQMICVFIMIFLKDMSQQINNNDFARHNANINCRTCLYSKNKRVNLNYNIIENERYHWKTIQQRQYASILSTDKKRKIFMRNTKIKIEHSIMTRVISVLNLILSKSYNALHFE